MRVLKVCKEFVKRSKLSLECYGDIKFIACPGEIYKNILDVTLKGCPVLHISLKGVCVCVNKVTVPKDSLYPIQLFSD